MSMNRRVPKNFNKINEHIRQYSGVFANWGKAGFKQPVPPEIIQVLSEISDESIKVVTKSVGRK